VGAAGGRFSIAPATFDLGPYETRELGVRWAGRGGSVPGTGVGGRGQGRGGGRSGALPSRSIVGEHGTQVGQGEGPASKAVLCWEGGGVPPMLRCLPSSLQLHPRWPGRA
jgi:hypothetical protein